MKLKYHYNGLQLRNTRDFSKNEMPHSEQRLSCPLCKHFRGFISETEYRCKIIEHQRVISYPTTFCSALSIDRTKFKRLV